MAELPKGPWIWGVNVAQGEVEGGNEYYGRWRRAEKEKAALVEHARKAVDLYKTDLKRFLTRDERRALDNLEEALRDAEDE